MPRRSKTPAATSAIDSAIRTLRGERVILDADLAKIYGVETKALNRAIERNADKFPSDFMFQLTAEEHQALKGPRKGSGFNS
jgi:hypothetical protein